MERKMTVFVSNMVGNDIELLYDVVCSKYKKFKAFYRLVEDLSETIDSLKYEFTSTTDLKVRMTMSHGTDLKSIVENLKSRIDSTNMYTYNIVSEGKKIIINISAE